MKPAAPVTNARIWRPRSRTNYRRFSPETTRFGRSNIVYVTPMKAPPADAVRHRTLVCSRTSLEFLVTRLFSATMFYHFTFTAVGLPMFGIAAMMCTCSCGLKSRVDVQRHLRAHAQLFAVASLVFLIFRTRFPVFSGGTPCRDLEPDDPDLVVLIVPRALPFFFAGVVVSLALTWFRDDVNRVYFFESPVPPEPRCSVASCSSFVGGPTA